MRKRSFSTPTPKWTRWTTWWTLRWWRTSSRASSLVELCLKGTNNNNSSSKRSRLYNTGSTLTLSGTSTRRSTRWISQSHRAFPQTTSLITSPRALPPGSRYPICTFTQLVSPRHCAWQRSYFRWRCLGLRRSGSRTASLLKTRSIKNLMWLRRSLTYSSWSCKASSISSFLIVSHRWPGQGPWRRETWST